MLLLGHLNVQSLVPKFCELKVFIERNKFDILALSETWLNDSVDSGSLMITDFNFVRADRNTGARGGGVSLYIHNRYRFERLDIPNDFNLEQLFVKVSCKGISFVVAVVYKPPHLPYKLFIDALETSLTHALSYCEDVICVGDVNVNFLDVDLPSVKYFDSMLSSIDMQQLIREPTHITPTSESLIDIILSNENGIVTSAFSCPSPFSRHKCVACKMRIQKTKIEPRIFTIRDCRGFDEQLLFDDISAADFSRLFHMYDIDEKVKFFSDTLMELFNKHFPERVIRTSKRRAPWMTDRIRGLMRERDKAKARYKKHKTEDRWEEYKHLRNVVNQAVKEEKRLYFHHITVNASSREQWKELKSLGISNKSRSYLNFDDPDEINDYFLKNPSFNSDGSVLDYYKDNLICLEEFNFRLVDEETVLKFLQNLKNSSPGFDNLSISFIKICCPLILPFIVNIFNTILLDSKFPTSWKHAQVTPIPKNRSPQQLSDLRPISILSGLSKLFEKIMADQLAEYLEKNSILPGVQSGFRPGYSSTGA